EQVEVAAEVVDLFLQPAGLVAVGGGRGGDSDGGRLAGAQLVHPGHDLAVAWGAQDHLGASQAGGVPPLRRGGDRDGVLCRDLADRGGRGVLVSRVDDGG